MTIQAVIWNWKNVKIVNSCTPSWGLAVTAVQLHCLMYTHAPSHLSFHYSNLQTAVSCTLGLAPCRPRYLLNTFFIPKKHFFHLSCCLQLLWPEIYLWARGEWERGRALLFSLTKRNKGKKPKRSLHLFAPLAYDVDEQTWRNLNEPVVCFYHFLPVYCLSARHHDSRIALFLFHMENESVE